MSRILIAALVVALAGLGGRALAATDPATSAVAPSAAVETADVTGTWALTVETSAGTGTPTLILEQAGGDLSGTYKGRFGDQVVTGTIAGNAIRFAFTVSGPMGSADVAYSGTVEGDTMSGTMQMGAQAGGRFTGRRQ